MPKTKASNQSAAWVGAGAGAIGLAIGSVLGMLFSPKSGRENRAMVAKGAKRVAVAARKEVQQVSKAAMVMEKQAVKRVRKAATKINAAAKKRK